ncbi:MAG: glycosyl transferase family protein [Elusimicrobiota bacterium]
MSAIEILTLTILIGTTCFGIDDLFLDLVHWINKTFHKVRTWKAPKLSIEKLNSLPEQRLALMIPCWKENEVIGQMLLNTLQTINYRNYDVFVGVYPNDPETNKVVESIQKVNPRIHKAMCPNPGPTNKADNLNSIIQEIYKYEQRLQTHFDIFVMHDAEDVIHPMSLKLFNYFHPQKEMVQIPVFPLNVKLRHWTHWTYADEFAENHTKDIHFRETIGGLVPSAGVGTSFSRYAIEKAAEKAGNTNQVFNLSTLTEDYSFSVLLNKFKMKSIFVHQGYKRIKNQRKWIFFGPIVPKEKNEWIATRAFFPTKYSNAIRQKSRWMLGISFQEWKESGWSGNLATRYSLFRDRKGPLGSILCLGGYFLMTYWILQLCENKFAPWTPILPGLPNSPLITFLFWVNFFFMCERALQRFIAVARIYGPIEGLFSVPRIIYGNFINANAFYIASKQFVFSLFTGEKTAWDKTTNRFPLPGALEHHRERLGDALLNTAAITTQQLEKALQEQKKAHRPLGQILIEQGALSEKQLVPVLSQIFHMRTYDENKFPIPKDYIQQLSTPIKSMLKTHQMVPLFKEGEKISILTSDRLEPSIQNSLLTNLQVKEIEPVLASSQQIDAIWKDLEPLPTA